MVSRGAVECSVAGGKGRGGAVMKGREGRVSFGWEISDRRVEFWGRGSGSSSCRRHRSSEVGVFSLVLVSGSDWPV